MRLKKITSILITAALLFSFVACSAPVISETQKKYAKALEKAGFIGVSLDVTQDDLDKTKEYGFYTALTDELDIQDMAGTFKYDADKVDSVLVALKSDDNNSLQVVVALFDDEEDAKNYYNSLKEKSHNDTELYNGYDGVKVVENNTDNIYQSAVRADIGTALQMDVYVDLSIEDNTVVFCQLSAKDDKLYSYNKAWDNIYSYLQIKSAKDLL